MTFFVNHQIGTLPIVGLHKDAIVMIVIDRGQDGPESDCPLELRLVRVFVTLVVKTPRDLKTVAKVKESSPVMVDSSIRRHPARLTMHDN